MIEADAPTNKRGEFAFTRLGDEEYRLGVREERVEKEVVANGGQEEPVTIQITR